MILNGFPAWTVSEGRASENKAFKVRYSVLGKRRQDRRGAAVRLNRRDRKKLLSLSVTEIYIWGEQTFHIPCLPFSPSAFYSLFSSFSLNSYLENLIGCQRL